jgi:AraC-like DNA-binding protein
MHARYPEALTVDDLARAAGMSRFHFSRRFRDEVEQSPYGSLLQLRLTKAAALLRRRSCSVTEAALSVGFNDVSRFSRMFRRTYGVLPSVHARRG